jgi:flagellar hook-basal body complex protein FliE
MARRAELNSETVKSTAAVEEQKAIEIARTAAIAKNTTLLSELSSKYGVMLRSIQSRKFDENEILATLEKQARITKDTALLRDVEATRKARTAAAVSEPMVATAGVAVKGFDASAVTQAMGSKVLPSLLRSSSGLLTAGTGMAFLGGAALAVGGALIAGSLINIRTLNDRLKGAQLAAASFAGSGAELKEAAAGYRGAVGHAAFAHNIEAGQAEDIASNVLTRIPKGIDEFMLSSNKASVSMQNIVGYGRALGISYQQSAQVATNLTMVTGRHVAPGAQREAYAMEQYTKVVSQAKTVQEQGVMSQSEFVNQMQTAISSTSQYQTDADDLAAMMRGMADVQSKSMPAVSAYGQAAANMTMELRNMGSAQRAVFGGGLKGIWDWSEKGGPEMQKQMMEMFPSFFGVGKGASSETKAIGMMLGQSLGLGEQTSRIMVESGKWSEKTTSTTAETANDIKSMNDGFKEMYGMGKKMLQGVDAMVRHLETLVGRTGL